MKKNIDFLYNVQKSLKPQARFGCFHIKSDQKSFYILKKINNNVCF